MNNLEGIIWDKNIEASSNGSIIEHYLKRFILPDHVVSSICWYLPTFIFVKEYDIMSGLYFTQTRIVHDVCEYSRI